MKCDCKNERWVIALPIITVFVFNIIIFNRYFPLSEGWWEAYGYLVNSGLRLFRDLDLPFSPLFVGINSFLLKTSGSSFFLIRLYGVFLITLCVFLLQILLGKFYSSKVSAVAAIFAAFLFMYSPQFIAKDYHTYLHLVTIVWLLVLIKSIDTPRGVSAFLIDVLVGVGVVVIFFLKSNVGVLLFCAVMFHFATYKSINQKFVRILMMFVGVVLTFILLNRLIGFDLSLISGNDAKGSLFTVLTRCVTDAANRRAILLAFLLAGAGIVAQPVFSRLREAEADGFFDGVKSVMNRFVVFDIVSPKYICIGLAVLVVVSGFLRNRLIGAVIPLALMILAVNVYKYILGRVHSRIALTDRQAVVLLPLCALAYANTNTASFDFIGLFEVIAFSGGAVLMLAAGVSINLRNFIAACMILMVPYVFIFKIVKPYEWWGNNQSSIFMARSSLNYPELKHIYVDKNTRRAFDAIHTAVSRFSKAKNDAYFFNLPIFYLLENKIPKGRLILHWFDVVTNRQLENDYKQICVNKPKLIVAYQPCHMAYVVHRNMKKVDHLIQEKFIKQFADWVVDGDYKFVRSVALRVPVNDKLASLQKVETDVVVLNDEFNRISLGSFARTLHLGDNHVVVLGVRRDKIVNKTTSVVNLGDVITLTGKREDVARISEKIGFAIGDGNEWNTVVVYAKREK